MPKEWIVSEEDLGCDGAYLSYSEVIRCRDCKHRFESLEMTTKDGNTVRLGRYCKATGQFVNDDDFCAWSERRTDDEHSD